MGKALNALIFGPNLTMKPKSTSKVNSQQNYRICNEIIYCFTACRFLP